VRISNLIISKYVAEAWAMKEKDRKRRAAVG
jgi:hypothetical protein